MLLLIMEEQIRRVNYEYHNLTTKRKCDETVYQLHSRGIIALHQDGSITITDKGQWHVRYVQLHRENISAYHRGGTRLLG